MQCSDMCIHCEVIPAIKLINISITSHSYHFLVYVVRILEIYPLCKFQVYNTVVLIIVTMLYARSVELIHLFILRTWKLCCLLQKHCEVRYTHKDLLSSFLHLIHLFRDISQSGLLNRFVCVLPLENRTGTENHHYHKFPDKHASRAKFNKLLTCISNC